VRFASLAKGAVASRVGRGAGIPAAGTLVAGAENGFMALTGDILAIAGASSRDGHPASGEKWWKVHVSRDSGVGFSAPRVATPVATVSVNVARVSGHQEGAC
jgi:hypothetical protein